MRRLVLAVAIVFLGASCATPPNPHLSRVGLYGHEGAVVTLLDGTVFRCAYAEETGTGWECWGGWGQNDEKPDSPRAYWPRAKVASVIAAPDGSPS